MKKGIIITLSILIILIGGFFIYRYIMVRKVSIVGLGTTSDGFPTITVQNKGERQDLYLGSTYRFGEFNITVKSDKTVSIINIKSKEEQIIPFDKIQLGKNL